MVLTEECRAETAQDDIERHAHRDQPTRCVHIHACQRRHHGTSSQQQLTRYQDVCRQGEENEDHVRDWAIAGVHDFQECVASWCVLLDLARDHCEHEDLYRGTSGVFQIQSV